MRHLAWFTAALAVGIAPVVWAQNTVGTTTYDPTNVFAGYTLIYPHNQPHTYLLNMCGEVVHQWDSEPDSRPGNTSYLLPNGDLLLTRRPAAVAANPIWAGGGGATIERRTWDNEVIWSYTQNDDSARFHHDIAPMPNGNVLAICWEALDSAAALAAGADPATLTGTGLWSEKVVELQPDGMGSATVVWEWRLWDHLVQDVNPDAANFGVVSENPHRVDLNYPQPGNVPADFVHMNSIDYNPINDHILLSAPEYNEVWIIDHGPFSSGELKWRWGNPAAYGMGDSTDQQLFYQHDANWVDGPDQVGSPLLGKISIFNNRVPGAAGPHSELTAVAPPYDEYENEYLLLDGLFAPEAADFTWAAAEPSGFYSSGLSSFQPLAGPRFLVCEGRSGRTSEITLAGDTVWQYVTPLQAGVPVAQGTELLPAANMTFRATRYPAAWPLFEGLAAEGAAVIELDPVPLPACLPCDLEVEVTWDGGLIEAVVTGGTAPVSLVWTDEAGNPCAVDAFDPFVPQIECPEFSPANEDFWFVNVTATDAFGCVASAQAAWAGIGAASQTVRIGPNPAADRLFISGFEAGSSAHLLDLNGRLVAERNLPSAGEATWPLPSLPAGLYIVSIGTTRHRLLIAPN